jgi:hypothetical protein
MIVKNLHVSMPVYDASAKVVVVSSLVHLTRALALAGVEMSWSTYSGSTVDWARNMLAREFLEGTNASHLLFIDSDMAFRAEDVIKMLDYDLDVLGAIWVAKTHDWDNVARVARENPGMDGGALALASASFTPFAPLGPETPPTDRPFEVAGVGTGLMLIKREILTRIAGAFPERTIRGGKGAGAHAFFEFGFDAETGEYCGEDIWFCRRVRQVGGKVFAAAWFLSGHMGNHQFLGVPGFTLGTGGRL